MSRSAASTLVLLASFMVACGYQVVRYRGALGDARTVAIQGLRNETREPGVDSLLTEAIHREFLRRGSLRLVDDPKQADLVMRGAVSQLDTRSLSFSSIQFVLEYQITLGLDLEVERRDGSPVPLHPVGLQETELYLASADVEAARKNRQEALRRLASVMAGRVHDALFERIVP